MMDMNTLRPMKPTGFSEDFLKQVERDSARRQPSAIRAGVTVSGALIVRCALTPLYDRSRTAIEDVQATVYHCPQCGDEHRHRVGRDLSGMQRGVTKSGQQLLVRQTAGCGATYYLTPYEDDRVRITRQLADNAAFLRKHAQEQARDSAQAKAALRRFLVNQPSGTASAASRRADNGK